MVAKANPVPLSKRVNKCRGRQMLDGWCHGPRVLPPEAAAALRDLIGNGYADNTTRAVTRALVEAARALTPSA